MKRFLLTAFLMLVAALAGAVFVWFLLLDNTTLLPQQPDTGVQSETSATTADEAREASPQAPSEELIPLRDLPLSDAQRSMLESAGIDVETFLITPQMLMCARSAVGEERFEAIKGGDSPSFIEGTKLLSCIH